MRVFAKLTITILLLLHLSSCNNNKVQTGFSAATVKFSAYETQHTGLWLADDSTFLFLSRPNEGMSWTLHSGRWRMTANKIYLDGGLGFGLWLKPVKGRLEILDFEGNEVISGKPVRLGKPDDQLWNQEINLVMTGKMISQDGVSYFLPCNTLQFIRLKEGIASTRQFDDRIITARLTLIPSEFKASEPPALSLESIFGPDECK
ncbi:MAG TPA: hypothetical protein PKE03_01525 [Bacteroidales bacterium]|nr:hypothetical protein [Bacteroidales bacterium]